MHHDSRTLRPACRRVLAPLLALLALSAGTPSPAHGAGLWRSDEPVRLEVVDREDGQVLRHYRHAGQAWMAAQPGHRYAVRLHNRSGERVLAVLSVDGINAIDGRSADPGQAGYVLGPWETLEVAGWRKSMETVAQFVFVDPAASYGARTGRADNLGVVGVAVFRERRPAYPDPPPAPPPGIATGKARDAAARNGAAAAGEAQRGYDPPASLGTGHGTVEASQAYRTAFMREASPVQVTEVRYDTPATLAARGIRLDPAWRWPPRVAHDRPRAFPGGFVPDP